MPSSGGCLFPGGFSSSPSGGLLWEGFSFGGLPWGFFLAGLLLGEYLLGGLLPGGPPSRGSPSGGQGVPPSRGILLGVSLLRVSLLGESPCLGVSPCLRGLLARGPPCQRGIPCDLSHHSFDVTCMLPPHQLRPTNSAAAYIVLVGHVTCKASWNTTPPPVNRITHTCKNITFL